MFIRMVKQVGIKPVSVSTEAGVLLESDAGSNTNVGTVTNGDMVNITVERRQRRKVIVGILS